MTCLADYPRVWVLRRLFNSADDQPPFTVGFVLDVKAKI